jgi:HSP20 family protein
MADFRDLIPFGRERRLAPFGRGGEHPFEAFQREMSRMFDDFFRGVPTRFTGAEAPFGAMPRVDVSETENEYELKAELPGLEEKDINLQLANNVLSIRGEKKAEREEKDKNYHLAERSFGSFQRSIPLPTEVEEDRVQASFKSGVLTVRLPKSERAKSQAKRIEVKSG